MIVSPKQKMLAEAQCYAGTYGVSMEVRLTPEQRWKATWKGHYWWLTRKGSTTRLRLTDAAFRRLFDVKEN